MSEKVANRLLDFLSTNGVQKLYGVNGDTIFSLLDALSQHNQIEFINTTSEINAAFMASYQAKLTGKPGVCVATSGPGIANLVNGLADAYFDRVPVLALTGQVALNKIGTTSKQYVNQQKLLQPVTYSSELVTGSDAVLPAISTALENAVQHKTVTHISLPRDLFDHQVKESQPVLDISSFMDTRHDFAGNISEAVQLLQEAKNPLLVIGLREQQLTDELQELSEKTGAAVIVGQQTKGVIPDHHPRVLGGAGEAYVPGILEEVDLILKLGTISFENRFLPSGKNIIQVVRSQGKVDYKNSNVALKGNVQEILQALLENLVGQKNEYWEEKIAEEKQNLKSLLEEQKENQTKPLHPAHVMTVLEESVPEDSIIVVDIGAFAHWFDTYFQAREQTVLISSNWRSMGSALPGAIGCSLQRPQKEVIVLTGDGGMLISLTEIATAVKYNLPITIIVANNQQYEIEKLKMQKKDFNPRGVKINNPDFAALAKDFGAEGVKVNTSEKLRSVLKESISKETPLVVDVELKQVQLPFV